MISFQLFYYTAKHCEKILDPYYGKAFCNGDVVGRKCRFTCYEGFKLSGPQERTCQANKTWSGINTKCLRKFISLMKIKTTFFVFVWFPILSKLFKYFDICFD